jgi:methionine-gamma-lyase
MKLLFADLMLNWLLTKRNNDIKFYNKLFFKIGENMSNSNSLKGFMSKAIHFAYNPHDHHDAAMPPIYQSSTFIFKDAQTGAARFAGQDAGHFYTRISNPTLDILEKRIAVLEGGAAGLAFGSGMGAVTTVLWTLLRPGQEIVVDKTIYGCTHSFLQHGLKDFGIEVSSIDFTDLTALKAALSQKTKVVYFETPANPNMRLIDIAAVSDLAHQVGATVVVDNTYCSPFLQRPIEFGADVVIHSATKYLAGHSDVIAGLAVFKDADLAKKTRLLGLKDLTGAVMSPNDAFLIMRGMMTLAVRMREQCKNAMIIARWLQKHPKIKAIYYPGLESDPYHGLAKRQMSDFGGMIAFEITGGFEAGRNFLNRLNLVYRAVSLGGCESLAQHPASMTHSSYTPEELKKAEIDPGLVRLSVGLEELEDLLADIEQALLDQ